MFFSGGGRGKGGGIDERKDTANNNNKKRLDILLTSIYMYINQKCRHGDIFLVQQCKLIIDKDQKDGRT